MKTRIVVRIFALFLCFAAAAPALADCPEGGIDRAGTAYLISHGMAGFDTYVPPSTATFTDVPTGYWAFKEIEYCLDHGVVYGYWDGYHPEETENRGRMAVYVARAMAGGDAYVPPGPDTPTFPDVPTDYWAYKYVEFLAATLGSSFIGYPDGTFRPAYPMTNHVAAAWIQAGIGASGDPCAVPVYPIGWETDPGGPDLPPDPEPGTVRHYLTGQLHAHWMSDDGLGVSLGRDYTPTELEARYRDAGYEFIAPTEHHPDPKWGPEVGSTQQDSEGRWFAPGMFQDPQVDGIIHLGDSMEDTADRSHILGAAFDDTYLQWDCVGYQDFWDTAEWRSNRLYNIRGYGNGLAFIAHPDSSSYPWSARLLAKLNGRYDGIEVFNGGIDVIPPLRWQARAIGTWTNLLKKGLDVRATAGDDFAPNFIAAFDRGCVTVVLDLPMSPPPTTEETKAAIEAALQQGRFYASYAPLPGPPGAAYAPQIQGWWYDTGSSRARVRAFCPGGLDEVRFFTGTNSDHGIRVSVAAVGGQADTWEASLSCTQADRWVRVEVRDDLGWRSLTQPIWLNRVEMTSAQWPALSLGARASAEADPLVLELADAHLEVSYPQPSVTTVTGELVAIGNRPEAAPPLGYIGQCYSFTPAVTLQGSNPITISFDPAQVGLCREEALSIFRYDESAGEWVAVASSVDAGANTVTAYIDRLGIYALSGVLGEDATPPDIGFLVPSAGAAVSGEIEIVADATDDNGVASVQFLMDDLYLGFDTTGAGGWTCPLDVSSYANGAHTLTVVGTDASGNESEASIEVNVSDGVPPPGITISSPWEGAILWGEVRAAGDWSGVLPFSSGMVSLGDTVVALADPVTPSGVAWAVDSEVDFQWYGPITLTVEGTDSVGNRALASVTVDFRTFSDITPSFWARDYIYATARANIVQGYPDGTYQPVEPVNRAQMAVYISRALAGGDANVPSGPATATFSDVPTDYWAFKYIEYCYDNGGVTGYWDGYHPEETVNRAQMAVYVARAMAGGDSNVPDDPDGTPFFPDVPSSYWAYKYVEYCHDQGVVGGYWDGYHPEETVNRAQMAVYVQRGFELPM